MGSLHQQGTWHMSHVQSCEQEHWVEQIQSCFHAAATQGFLVL